jgi:diacylglycerol kinase family enzyme
VVSEVSQSILAVINPQSGSGAGRLLKNVLQTISERRGWSLEILDPQAASLLSKNDWSHFSKYIIAGGDGTLSHQMCRFAGSSKPFHIFPLGTGNDLAREYGLSYLAACKEEHVERYLTSQVSRGIQVWECAFIDTEEAPVRFMNYLSIGLEASVIKRFSERRVKEAAWYGARIMNRLRYARYALESLQKEERLYVEKLTSSENKHFECPPHLLSISFTNLSSLMGLAWQCPRGNAEDSMIEIRFIQSMWNYVRTVSRFGRPAPYVQSGNCTIELGSAVTCIQFDGESKALRNTIKKFQTRPLGTVHIVLAPSV